VDLCCVCGRTVYGQPAVWTDRAINQSINLLTDSVTDR